LAFRNPLCLVARISTSAISTQAGWQLSRCDNSPAFSGRIGGHRESHLELQRTRTIPHVEENNLIVIRRCEDGWLSRMRGKVVEFPDADGRKQPRGV
jgi:hypothetical protein